MRDVKVTPGTPLSIGDVTSWERVSHLLHHVRNDNLHPYNPFIDVYTCVHMCVYVCMCLWVHVCVHVCVCMHVCLWVHTHVCVWC